MILSRLLVSMLVVMLVALPVFTADPLFPRTVLCGAAVTSRMSTSLSLPEGMKTVVPQLLKTTAAWPSRKLVEEPAAAAKVLGDVPAGTAIWKLGTKDGFMLVLVPVAAPGEGYAAYAGKCWEMGWMRNRE